MYKNILIPIDLNQNSSWQKALPTALEYCRAFGAKLHVMTVIPDFGMAISSVPRTSAILHKGRYIHA